MSALTRSVWSLTLFLMFFSAALLPICFHNLARPRFCVLNSSWSFGRVISFGCCPLFQLEIEKDGPKIFATGKNEFRPSVSFVMLSCFHLKCLKEIGARPLNFLGRVLDSFWEKKAVNFRFSVSFLYLAWNLLGKSVHQKKMKLEMWGKQMVIKFTFLKKEMLFSIGLKLSLGCMRASPNFVKFCSHKYRYFCLKRR